MNKDAIWKCKECLHEVGVTERQYKFHEINKSGKVQKTYKKLNSLWVVECPICGHLLSLEDDVAGKNIKEDLLRYCYFE